MSNDKIKKKTELLCHLVSNDSLTIIKDDRLPVTESKIICQFSDPKSGRGRLRNLSSGPL